MGGPSANGDALTLHFLEHVVHGQQVLIPRAEENNLRVPHYSDTVPWFPIEQILAIAGLFGAIGERHHDFPRNHVTPMRRLAGVPLKPHEQWCYVSSLSKRKIFALHCTETRCVTEGLGNSSLRPGHIDLRRNLVFRNMHFDSPFFDRNSGPVKILRSRAGTRQLRL